MHGSNRTRLEALDNSGRSLSIDGIASPNRNEQKVQIPESLRLLGRQFTTQIPKMSKAAPAPFQQSQRNGISIVPLPVPTDFPVDHQRTECPSGNAPDNLASPRYVAYSVVVVMVVTDYHEIYTVNSGRRIADDRVVGIEQDPVTVVLQQKAAMSHIIQPHPGRLENSEENPLSILKRRVMLGHLRPYVGPLKRLLAWPYLKLGLSPGQVGLFGVALALAAALLIRLGFETVAFWIAMAAVLTDMADGEVARERGEVTPLGNYLDAMGDRLREGLLLVGLLPHSPNLVCLALLGTCLTSFAKARTSLVLITDNRDWPGFGDHPDRAVMLLFCYFFCHHITLPLSILVLATWSCFLTRLRTAEKLISEAEPSQLLPYLRPKVSSEEYQR